MFSKTWVFCPHFCSGPGQRFPKALGWVVSGIWGSLGEHQGAVTYHPKWGKGGAGRGGRLERPNPGRPAGGVSGPALALLHPLHRWGQDFPSGVSMPDTPEACCLLGGSQLLFQNRSAPLPSPRNPEPWGST